MVLAFSLPRKAQFSELLFRSSSVVTQLTGESGTGFEVCLGALCCASASGTLFGVVLGAGPHSSPPWSLSWAAEMEGLRSAVPQYQSWILFFFFLDFIYLFDREREHRQREQQREGEADSLLSKDPVVGPILGPWDGDLSSRQTDF